jgi:hypothetical protein
MSDKSDNDDIGLRLASKLGNKIGAMAAATLESQEAAARSATEIETLAIAKEANVIARSASDAASRSARYAMYAAAIAATVMIVENKDMLIALIFGNP